MNETELKGWYIVSLTEAHYSELSVTILWGIVEEDFTGRWTKGDFVTTSPISECDGTNVYTRSGSHYVLKGEGKIVDLPLKGWQLMRLGYDPDTVKFMIDD